MLERNQPSERVEPGRVPDAAPVDLAAASLPARPEPSKPLDEKVANFVSAVTARLSQSELPRRAYSELIFEAAKQQGLVEGSYDYENAGKVGHLMYQLERKLGVRVHYGLNGDYHSLPSVSLGAEASADVAGYQRLQKETGEHLRASIGSSPIDEGVFANTVRAFVDQWVEKNCPRDSIAYSSGFQRAGLHGHMIGTYQRDFDIRTAKPRWGGIDLEAIDDAFGRL